LVRSQVLYPAELQAQHVNYIIFLFIFLKYIMLKFVSSDKGRTNEN